MNEPKQNGTLTSVITLARATWEATHGDRVRFFGFIILSVLAYSIDLVVPWAIGWILNVFVSPRIHTGGLRSVLEVHGGIRRASYVDDDLSSPRSVSSRHLRVLSSLQQVEEVFGALVAFPLKWHVHHHSGENLSRLNRSVGAIEGVINNYLWQIVDGMVKFFFATLALFTLDFEVAITVLVMGFVTVAIMLLFNRRLTKKWRSNNRFFDKLNRTCVDYLSNIITVKTLRLENPALTYLMNQRNEGYRLCRKIWKYQELKWGTISAGYSLVMGSSLFIFFRNHVGDTAAFDVAQVYVLLNYLDRIFGAITSFTGYYGGIIEASLAYDDASSVLNESKELKIPLRPSTLPRSWNAIGLEDVTFSYGGESQNLRDVFMNLRKGEKIALVGPSGGGKSTLLKVLSGMLAANSGSVTSTEGKRYTLDDIADISLLVPQEPEVFSESLRYNLSFNRNFSDQELMKALELCKIDHLIQKLPNGLDSALEEAGLNISGGERQRLALARGILRFPGKDILLLDEPTSSLDPLTEKQIFANILNEFKELTVVTACHRLALVPLFDTVVYIRDGRVEEIGSFSDLRAAGRGFSAAWADYERTVVKVEQHA